MKKRILKLVVLSSVILSIPSLASASSSCSATCTPGCTIKNDCVVNPQAIPMSSSGIGFNGELCTGGHYACVPNAQGVYHEATFTVKCTGDFEGEGTREVCTPGTTCGNGIKEAGEECDDKNTQAGDGCNEKCNIEDPTCGSDQISACEGSKFEAKYTLVSKYDSIDCYHCEDEQDPEYPCTNASLGPRASSLSDKTRCLGQCDPIALTTVQWNYEASAPSDGQDVVKRSPSDTVYCCEYTSATGTPDTVATSCIDGDDSVCVFTVDNYDGDNTVEMNCTTGELQTATCDCPQVGIAPTCPGFTGTPPAECNFPT